MGLHSDEPPVRSSTIARSAGTLRARTRQLQAVSELGFEALARPKLLPVAERAVNLVAEVLSVEIVTVEERLDDSRLIVRAAVGLGPVVKDGERATAGSESLANYTLAADGPVISDDVQKDSRFSVRPSFIQAGMHSGISVAIGAPEVAWGVLVAGSTRERYLAADDIAFLQSVSHLLHSVVQLERGERELQRLADAVEDASDAIISVDRDGRIKRWNHGAERLMGVAAEQAIGRTIGGLNELTGEPQTTGMRSKSAVEAVLSTGRGFRYETRRKRGDKLVDLSVEVTPWRVDGRIAGVTNLVTDITARKQADQTNARLAAIVEGSDDAIIGKDLAGEITSWNPSAERIYGYTAAEAVGTNISMLVPEERLAELDGIMQKIVGGTSVTHLETVRRRKDGRVIDVSVTISPIRDANGDIVGAATVGRDITERRQNERARDQALENLAEAQRLAKLGSWTWCPETDEGTWSAQMYEIFGRDPAEGPATGEVFFGYLHPEDQDRTMAAYVQTFGGGSSFEFEFRILHRDGRSHDLHLLGYEDPANPGRYVGTVQDVTDQREAERERIELHAATVRAESANRAKSEFLARMSHELRTPLNSILGFGQLLELDQLEARQHERVTLVLKAARHLLDLINEVLDLAGIEAGRLTVSPEPVALAELVNETVSLVTPLASERNIELRIDPSGLADDEHVKADRNRLKQVLLNVLSNAIKYNRPGGRVHVTFDVDDHGRVRTRIADNGVGIASEQLPRLFEPFERLGAEMTEIEGTGLGLSLAKGLIEAMSGTIEVESTSGEGTNVTIELAEANRPTAGPLVAAYARAAVTLGADAAKQVILYIEDNLSNLTLVEQIFEPHPNVELISAMQGSMGIDLARRHHPALIVLDLHLPDMPGTEVLKRLKADPITSRIPVAVLTADAARDQAGKSRTLGAACYMTKPLDVTHFLQVVSELLAAHRDPDT